MSTLSPHLASRTGAWTFSKTTYSETSFTTGQLMYKQVQFLASHQHCNEMM